MGKFKNYYEVLELTPFSDPETVKASFRRLARRYHPDLNAGNASAEEKFKEINEAYEVLGDTDKRQRYDETLRLVLNPKSATPNIKAVPPQYKAAAKSTTKSSTSKYPSDEKTSRSGAASSTPISEIFETFKRNLNQGASAKAPTPTPPPAPAPPPKKSPPPEAKAKPDGQRVFKTDKAKRGEDVTVEAQITPLEAEEGVVKTVNVQHNELCRRCSGTGRINGLLCNGCNGEKVIVRLKKIDVRIPGGVKHGSRVRIAREGGRGVNGGEPGDLFLLIRIAVDPSLRIDGLNVYCDLPVPITDAVLGAEVEVPTLTGKVKMTIPSLTASGKVFRLKEQGVQSGATKGDQFVTIHIAMPETLLPREKELYQELARLRKDK
jgi:DnaJ-class molecular chaperone